MQPLAVIRRYGGSDFWRICAAWQFLLRATTSTRDDAAALLTKVIKNDLIGLWSFTNDYGSSPLFRILLVLVARHKLLQCQ